MAVEIYKSNYVTAESALNYIDVSTIENACKNIKEAVLQLKQVGKKIGESKDYCSKECLAVDGVTMEDELDECVVNYSDTAEYMDVFADTIRGALQRAVDAKQTQLNAVAKSEEELIRSREETFIEPVVVDKEV